MLMRYRGYENNDLGRIEAAHGFMHAVLSQFLSVDSLWNLPELAGIAM